MKRTKSINHATFRKSFSARHLTPVALAVSAVFMLAGCEKSDETVSLYQNADDCSTANPGKSAECTTAYNNALKEAERTAPKYATREDCVAEFGENQCQQAPAQAGMTGENQAQAHSGGSFWMPLMAGYMMGRMMGGGAGFAQQPLFTSRNPASPAYGQYNDASGKSYGAAQPGRTMTVPKTAMAPKPATTTTVTRGGFGESVAKQSAMQRSSATGTSSRSMGG
ncbi:DUF1190 family protein [Atlantibacter hermannii]|nr:DUF1190 family protein [Atlantibacter hermannii]NBC98329.1 DUF1190 family protein [Atlantibacter hermannii]